MADAIPILSNLRQAQITVGVSSLAFYKWRERYSELTIEIAIDDSMADIQILYNFRKYFLINNL